MRTLVSSIIIALAAFTPAPASADSTQDLNPVVWTVNKQPVHAVEISLMMHNLAAQAQQMGQQPDQQEILEIATQRVIERKLLVQEAKRFGIEPDEEQVAAMTEQMNAQAGGREQLEEILQRGGASYDDAVQSLREMILVMQLVDSQIAPTIKVADDEVTAFYNDNKERFSSPEQVHARHIIFKVEKDADETAVAAAKQQAEAARVRAKAGEDFADLARELSQGPSAPDGGDLGFFSHERMVPEFADAAFALAPGEISEVVRSSFGFHVIKSEERREAATQSFEEVKDRIATGLRQQKVGSAIDGLLETLSTAAEIKPVDAPTASPE